MDFWVSVFQNIFAGANCCGKGGCGRGGPFFLKLGVYKLVHPRRFPAISHCASKSSPEEKPLTAKCAKYANRDLLSRINFDTQGTTAQNGSKTGQSRISAYYLPLLPARRSRFAREPAAPMFNRLAIQCKVIVVSWRRRRASLTRCGGHAPARPSSGRLPSKSPGTVPGLCPSGKWPRGGRPGSGRDTPPPDIPRAAFWP